MLKRQKKVQELDSALGQIEKDITSTETRLSKINETMVAIREKELLINRYETSISEIKKYMTINRMRLMSYQMISLQQVLQPVNLQNYKNN